MKSITHNRNDTLLSIYAEPTHEEAYIVTTKEETENQKLNNMLMQDATDSYGMVTKKHTTFTMTVLWGKIDFVRINFEPMNI